MLLNIERLKEAGVTVRAFRNNDLFELPKNTKIELFFEHGQYPKELHEAIHKLMPGLKIEADIVAEGTFRKVQDFQLLHAIRDNEGE
jgi:hypothetical protein